MNPRPAIAALDRVEPVATDPEHTWAIRALLLWRHRRTLMRVTVISLGLSVCISLIIPKEYKSTARIMPPDQREFSALTLAALTSSSGTLGALGSLAGGLLGAHSTSDLFIDLLRSATVSNHLIDRFNLQHVYGTRYRIDAAKRLARRTKITQDKKSGVITVEVEDTNRVRARDLAQGYLTELNSLVTATSTSAAHRERVFIEQRLQSVQANLENAEIQLSQFSSQSSAVDIREQTRAMVDAGARLQGELLVEESGLQSLRQIYGDKNVRVQEAEARIASLKSELAKLTGSSSVSKAQTQTLSADPGTDEDGGPLYPALRQLPQLAVPYADLSRRVKVQEAVYELLKQQYEMSRIEEAKDIPAVSVIDPPGISEKKSFPPRTLLTLALTLLSFVVSSVLILVRDRWSIMAPDDPRKALAAEVLPAVHRRLRPMATFRRGSV